MLHSIKFEENLLSACSHEQVKQLAKFSQTSLETVWLSLLSVAACSTIKQNLSKCTHASFVVF